MDDGLATTGWGPFFTGRPSSLQYIAPERGPMPPRIGSGAPQSSALPSSSAPPGISTRTHTAPCYIDDHSPAAAVSTLPQQGAHVGQEDQHGNTPLMHLVGKGQFDAARLLVDAGADPAYRNHAGHCAVDLAMAQGEFLEAAGLAEKAASAAGTKVTALLGRLDRRIAVLAKDDTTSSTATTNTTAAAARVTVPAASFSPGSTASVACTMEDAFKAIANDDLAALERILPMLRRSRQGKRSQQHDPARSGSSRVRMRIPKSALLKMAACLGRSSLIPALLDRGALLEHADADGDTALILAAKHGHTAAMTLLLQAGADMEHADAAGWTALVHAAHMGKDDVAAMLVARGANMAVRDKTGALLMAVALKNSDDAELRSLSRRALKQRVARKPPIPVTVAPATTHELLSNVFRAVEKKDAPLLGQLLAQTSNYTINIRRELRCRRKPDASNNALLKDRMMSPLMLAAFSGDEACLELLLDAGADVAQSDSSGMTALMWAARGGCTAAVETLLDGGKVDQADASGATALIHAVESRVAATVQALVDAGAIVDHVTKDGWTALVCAANSGDAAIIRVLLRAGAKTDQPGPFGKTALHIAAYLGDTPSVKVLLKAKAGVDQATESGWTALMVAAAQGHDAIVKALLQAGARTNLARPRGMTALMYAAEKGHIVALQSLLRAGAAIDQVNSNGASALMCAAYEGQHAAVKILLDAGANFRLKAKDVGYTALRIAKMRQHFESVELLRAKGADSESSSEENSL